MNAVSCEMHVGTERHSITLCFSEYMLIVWENFDTKLFEHSTRANSVSGVTLNGFHRGNSVHDQLPASFIKIILISHEYLAALHIIILYTTCPGKWLCSEKQKYSQNQMYSYMTS
jgi:hypothetical protein